MVIKKITSARTQKDEICTLFTIQFTDVIRLKYKRHNNQFSLQNERLVLEVILKYLIELTESKMGCNEKIGNLLFFKCFNLRHKSNLDYINWL